jgi:hypothetical protein
MANESTPVRQEQVTVPSDMTAEIEQKLSGRYGHELAGELAPAIKFAVEAHDGHDGLDGKPLVMHCADVALSPLLETVEERQLGLLHDAATPGYSNFTQEEFIEKARAAGFSEKLIAAAVCFERPQEGWEYDDWISFLMRDELTRKGKLADSEAAIANFPPASDNQLAAWKRTAKRLADNESELPEVTERIEASMRVHPLPDIRALG